MQKQQEQILITAFRTMHPEDRAILLEFAKVRASRQVNEPPKLSLIVSNFHPPDAPLLGSGSSEIEDVLPSSEIQLLKKG